MRNGVCSISLSIAAFPARFFRLVLAGVASAGIAVLAGPTAFAQTSVSSPRDVTPPNMAPVRSILMDLTRRAMRHSSPADRQPDRPREAAVVEAAPDGFDLSPAAVRVSWIAPRNGDTRYLMIDKAHGKLILFADRRPIFSGAALTGESLADQLPPDAINKSVRQHVGVRYRVTPAGRFTMTRGHDPALGETLDINELQGVDWTIAVHRVYLGNRSEHRDARLLSPNGLDKHITTGCIDVDAATIRRLLRLLPTGGMTPIYILPTDESLIATLFRPRDSASGTRVSFPARHGPV